jgi:hypothetical protein
MFVLILCFCFFCRCDSVHDSPRRNVFDDLDYSRFAIRETGFFPGAQIHSPLGSVRNNTIQGVHKLFVEGGGRIISGLNTELKRLSRSSARVRSALSGPGFRCTDLEHATIGSHPGNPKQGGRAVSTVRLLVLSSIWCAWVWF